MRLSGADILWSSLCEHGVDTVFGYPDGASGRDLHRTRTVVVRYAHAIDSLDRIASVLRRQGVRADAFTAVAAPDGATAQATIMFESTDRTAARRRAARSPGRGARRRGVDR